MSEILNGEEVDQLDKVWPMRGECPVVQGRDLHYESWGERGKECCMCHGSNFVPIEDMATLCRELRKAGANVGLDAVNGGVIAQVEGHTSVLDDPEEALVNASIGWAKEKR